MKNFTLLVLSPVVLLLLAFSAAAQTVVLEADITRQAAGTLPTNNWVGYTATAASGIQFTAGPGTAPLGCGSVQLTTPAGSDKAWLYNYDYTGTALSDITALFYLTYQTAGIPIQVASINIEIDFNGPEVAGGYSVLVFEPHYNTPAGTIHNNSWQAWDAFDGGRGIWWSTRPINGVCASGCFVTWDFILTNNPQAYILGGFGINQGTGNPGLISAVDVLSIGVSGTTTVYDFEASPPAIYYSDADGDGYGDAGNSIEVCAAAAPPAGYVANNYDCDDTDGKKKILVCHKGISLCINEKALPAHIKLGGEPGPCPTALVIDVASIKSALIDVHKVSAYPSPSTGEVNIQLPLLPASRADIIIMKANGTLVESRSSAAAGQVEKFELRRNGPGLFFIKVITENGVDHIKVLVQ